MNYHNGLYLLPEHMHHGVINYIEKGISGGSFLDAVVRNNLFQAYSCADYCNKEAMESWVAYFGYYAPAGCNGNSAVVDAWMEQGGLHGIANKGLAGTGVTYAGTFKDD